MRSLVFATAVLVASVTGANAQGVVNEIDQFRQVNVDFSSNAGACNLTDAKMFANHLAEKLEGAGVKQNDKAELDANLSINGVSFGGVTQRCTYYIGLSFAGVLMADDVVTDNPAVRATLDRLNYLPVTVYNAGRFGTVALSQPAKGGPSVTAQNRVMNDIDEMVAKFAASRTR